MGRVKALMGRYGGSLWPDGLAPAHQPPSQLTIAAKRLAEEALEGLKKFGVAATLDEAGRARFKATRFLPPAAKLAIERHGDLIQAFLRESSTRNKND